MKCAFSRQVMRRLVDMNKPYKYVGTCFEAYFYVSVRMVAELSVGVSHLGSVCPTDEILGRAVIISAPPKLSRAYGRTVVFGEKHENCCPHCSQCEQQNDLRFRMIQYVSHLW